MKSNELTRLRKLVDNEIKKRERINSLLQEELVKEYLKLKRLDNKKVNSKNIKEIIEQVLEDFKITKTNGIYVCTSAWVTDCRICYEETYYSNSNVEIDAEYAESKTYSDIELGNYIYASLEGSDDYRIPSIKDFEREHIVLNPTNSSVNKNDFEKVRMEFFETAIKEGQTKSKNKILSKYKRL